MTITDVGNSDLAEGVALDSAGRILVVGRTGTNMSGGINDFYIARYHADGSLDGTFGISGLVITRIGTDDGATDILMQPDGKFVVAGTSDGQIAVVRYLASGSPDPSFGSGSVARIGSLGLASHGDDVRILLQPDGRILFGTTTSSGPSSQLAVGRLLPDGTPDPSFAGGGGETIPVTGDGFFGALAMQDDGRILITGSSNIDTVDRLAVWRLTADGALDPTFGSGGLATTGDNVNSIDGISIAVQPNRRIVVGARTSSRRRPTTSRSSSACSATRSRPTPRSQGARRARRIRGARRGFASRSSTTPAPRSCAS